MAAGSTTFDAAAETAKYLATLSPEAHARATAYTQGGHWLLLWGTLVAILVSWIIIRTGVLPRIRDGAGKGGIGWLAALAVLPVWFVMDSLLSLPWALYTDWWRQTQYGLTSQALGGWFADWGKGLGVGLVMTVILFSLIYWLMRLSPRRWWLWGGLVTSAFLIFGMVIAPVLIEPLFNKYTPAPPGPVRETVVAMAQANGVPSDKIFIYNGSKQSNAYTANVSGLFGSARVAMSDTMFKKGADIAEVRGVVGHEMGHYVHMHALWFAGVFSVVAMLGFWLANRLFPLAARLMGSGVETIADPAGLPVLMTVLSVLSLLGTPLINTVVRTAEADADNFSLQRVNEPDGLAKALVKTIEYRAATPGRWEEIIFYDHPSVGWRVRNAMDWKAAHLKPEPATVNVDMIELPPADAGALTK
ncbi:MAG TPA: M48 family metallopeptidase [Caulobacter sp.]|nr:M48 family metallopeptidase [Caulobacter sp.]